ncbi:thiamine diphosphokinase [Candidatus Gottesmanbacteria bacterium]|nr:thiamine diphosphokinase [Candidatus Gottesmanbacteria bacterium]
MSQVIIVANGDISSTLELQINPGDFLVGVDAGALYLLKHYYCDLAIGDFDSVTKKQLDQIKNYAKEIKIYSSDKDFTDTELALEEVVRRGFKNIVIIGAIGTRMDHTLGNLFLLEKFLEEGIKIKIIDEHNEIEILNNQITVPPDKDFKYISFISLTETVILTLSRFKYPLKNHLVKRGQTLCLSNEFLDKKAKILVKDGKVLMIKSRD